MNPRLILALIFSIILLIVTSGCERSNRDDGAEERAIYTKMMSDNKIKLELLRASINHGYIKHPVHPGYYGNYLNNPVYGHWGLNGHWVWKNPDGHQANHTVNYLIASGFGDHFVNIITKEEWDLNWTNRTKTILVKYFIDKTGKHITSIDYGKHYEVYKKEREERVKSIRSDIEELPIVLRIGI